MEINTIETLFVREYDEMKEENAKLKKALSAIKKVYEEEKEAHRTDCEAFQYKLEEVEDALLFIIRDATVEDTVCGKCMFVRSKSIYADDHPKEFLTIVEELDAIAESKAVEALNDTIAELAEEKEEK